MNSRYSLDAMCLPDWTASAAILGRTRGLGLKFQIGMTRAALKGAHIQIHSILYIQILST